MHTVKVCVMDMLHFMMSATSLEMSGLMLVAAFR